MTNHGYDYTIYGSDLPLAHTHTHTFIHTIHTHTHIYSTHIYTHTHRVTDILEYIFTTPDKGKSTCALV